VIEWCDIPDQAAFARLVLQAPEPVIVAFETDDCEHCRQQRSLLALAWRHMGWSAPTFRLNAARLPQLADEHRIAGYPTIAVFDEGRLVERFPGRRDPASLTRRLTTLLGVPGGRGRPHDEHAPTLGDRLNTLLTAPTGRHVHPPASGGLLVRMEPGTARGADADPAHCSPASCRCTA
jgi:thioredoxin-like negative regulator of GroEL